MMKLVMVLTVYLLNTVFANELIGKDFSYVADADNEASLVGAPPVQDCPCGRQTVHSANEEKIELSNSSTLESPSNSAIR